MKLHGHVGLTTENAGFVVHPEKGWLGASPDTWIRDPLAGTGMAKFKCLFTKAEVLPEEASRDAAFYCTSFFFFFFYASTTADAN